MKTKYLALLVAGVIIAGTVFLSSQGKVTEQKKASSGELAGEVSTSAPAGAGRELFKDYPAPDFYINSDGKTTTLSELGGKKIFINFWNTWCPPCKEEMPDLNRLYLENKGKAEFLFINITAQEKTTEEVTGFLKDKKLQLPVYLDRDAGVAQLYGVRSIPTTVVLGPGGKVLYAQPGLLTYEQAAELIK